MSNNQQQNPAVDSERKPNSLKFGAFTLDLQRHGLYRGNTRLRLTYKPFETLAVLVAHRGETVGKQKLLDAVWKDSFVTEDSLVKAVREIRRVLEDEKANPQYIQTVPGEGYRFIAEVSRADQPEKHPEPVTEVRHSNVAPEAEANAKPVAGHRRVRFWTIVAVAGLLTALVAVVLLRWGKPESPRHHRIS